MPPGAVPRMPSSWLPARRRWRARCWRAGRTSSPSRSRGVRCCAACSVWTTRHWPGSPRWSHRAAGSRCSPRSSRRTASTASRPSTRAAGPRSVAPGPRPGWSCSPCGRRQRRRSRPPVPRGAARRGHRPRDRPTAAPIPARARAGALADLVILGIDATRRRRCASRRQRAAAKPARGGANVRFFIARPRRPPRPRWPTTADLVTVIAAPGRSARRLPSVREPGRGVIARRQARIDGQLSRRHGTRRRLVAAHGGVEAVADRRSAPAPADDDVGPDPGRGQPTPTWSARLAFDGAARPDARRDRAARPRAVARPSTPPSDAPLASPAWPTPPP